MLLLSVALERADYANGCFKNRASAEKLLILTDNAAAASPQAAAALHLLCDGILTSNLTTDRAPRHDNIACSVLWHYAVKDRFCDAESQRQGSAARPRVQPLANNR